MELACSIETRNRHRVALALVLGCVLSAIPIAFVLRPASPAPCTHVRIAHRHRHVAIVSAGPDRKFGTADDIEACR